MIPTNRSLHLDILHSMTLDAYSFDEYSMPYW